MSGGERILYQSEAIFGGKVLHSLTTLPASGKVLLPILRFVSKKASLLLPRRWLHLCSKAWGQLQLGWPTHSLTPCHHTVVYAAPTRPLSSFVHSAPSEAWSCVLPLFLGSGF
ncbi:UNVERIFIED_CONTAM: hypothetical protein K2H54_025494 [Gekko kuhli]